MVLSASDKLLYTITPEGALELIDMAQPVCHIFHVIIRCHREPVKQLINRISFPDKDFCHDMFDVDCLSPYKEGLA